jgi:lipopolysaccharide transport system ATP-binding protein
MHVRLGFAVAAPSRTESCWWTGFGGDDAPSRKMHEMGDVARAGRTIIFVSHNMASIESLCSSCLLVSAGRLEAKGEPAQIAMRYLASELRGSGGVRSLIEHPGRRGDSMPIATSICLRSEGDTPTGVVRMGAPFETTVDFNAPHPIRPILGLTLKTVDGCAV